MVVLGVLGVLGVLENVLFGSDSPGVAHQVSVGFFFLTVAGVLALVAIGVVAVVRRMSATRSVR